MTTPDRTPTLRDYIDGQNECHGPWVDADDLIAAAHEQRARECGIADDPTDEDREHAEAIVRASAEIAVMHDTDEDREHAESLTGSGDMRAALLALCDALDPHRQGDHWPDPLAWDGRALEAQARDLLVIAEDHEDPSVRALAAALAAAVAAAGAQS